MARRCVSKDSVTCVSRESFFREFKKSLFEMLPASGFQPLSMTPARGSGVSGVFDTADKSSGRISF